MPLLKELWKTNRRSKEIFDVFMIVFGVSEHASLNSLLTLETSKCNDFADGSMCETILSLKMHFFDE